MSSEQEDRLILNCLLYIDFVNNNLLIFNMLNIRDNLIIFYTTKIRQIFCITK